jgi:hypothetical protein
MYESKRRRVFVAEYRPKMNSFRINDSLKINVRSAWVEQRWAYANSYGGTLVIGGYCMIIDTDESDLKGYFETWLIGTHGSRFFRMCNRDCLMTDFDEMPNAIESWEVQAGWRVDSSAKKTIIGEFVMVKQ